MTYSDGAKRGWTKLNPEQRKERMSKVAKARWAKATDEQRSEQARKMHAGKKNTAI